MPSTNWKKPHLDHICKDLPISPHGAGHTPKRYHMVLADATLAFFFRKEAV